MLVSPGVLMAKAPCAAPQSTAGLLQVNVQVPPALTPGTYPVVLTIGGKSSPAGVTVTVR